MTTLKVQRRNMETKAKKLRREGYVTGNVFGNEIEGSIPLQIEKQEAERIERECMKGSQLYLELDGKTYDVLIKEMDYRPMDHQILEMDFQALVKGEKVHSVAEVILLNKEKVTEGVLEQLLEEIAYKADGIHYYVRKAAHMTEYFLLAIAISFPLYVYGVRGIWLMILAGIVCVGFAGLDEYHQSFVDARTPAVKDVGIDSIGAFIGILLVQAFCWSVLNNPNKKKKKRSH